VPFDPELAALRFGLGLRPGTAPPASPAALLAEIDGPDLAARRVPVDGMAEARALIAEHVAAQRLSRDGADAAARQAATERASAARAESARRADLSALSAFARLVGAEHPLRERLVLFWADHFTVRARSGIARHLPQAFVEDAIRPHLGSFPDMLVAAVTHPVMILYLDQGRSIGPGSRAARAAGRGGLNENLARELLELHTVGVGGPYDQDDVRELAELLTGLGVSAEAETQFLPARAEPGRETVMGMTFAREASLPALEEALRRLALHPATATHLARKLAVHFVASDPDPGLVAALAAAYRDSRGDLRAVLAALIDHPAAWAPERRKVRPPVEFLAASLRALGMDPAALLALDRRGARRFLLAPLAAMGQPWQEPPDPDGWPEEEAAWVTPPFVAARIDWAMNRPEELIPELPAPPALVEAALGGLASEELRFAAGIAERQTDGVGVVLASAEFQRR
jgi:uncharacterized protein (DUF1800 family)